MANEAALVQEYSLPVNFTCANGTAGTNVEQGTILKLTSPMTASASAGANDIVAGILQTEKIGGDGTTSMSVYRDGLFRVKCSGSISAGHAVVTGATANYVRAAAVNEENVLGIMLEDATEGATKLMELRPVVMNLS